MICPKAKDGSCNYKADCPDSIEHKCDSGCGATGYFYRQEVKYDCPTCIPYIPEQPKEPATCPECGHTVSEHTGKGFWLKDQPNRFCQCNLTPADLKPAERQVSRDFSTIEHESAEPQAEMMPLVKNLITYPPEIAEALEAGKIRQQRADMAWLPAHDQQVRQAAVKEFAEKICETLPQCSFVYDADNAVKAHIRAMAE
jgi:hypothetical protein